MQKITKFNLEEIKFVSKLRSRMLLQNFLHADKTPWVETECLDLSPEDFSIIAKLVSKKYAKYRERIDLRSSSKGNIVKKKEFRLLQQRFPRELSKDQIDIYCYIAVASGAKISSATDTGVMVEDVVNRENNHIVNSLVKKGVLIVKQNSLFIAEE